MGSGPARSSRMAAMARRWAAVSAKGRPSTNRSTRVGAAVVAGDHVADAAGVLLQPVLAQDQGQLQPEELVEGQPAAGRLRLVHGGGPVDVVEGRGPVDQVEAGRASRRATGRRRDRPGPAPHPHTGRCRPR